MDAGERLAMRRILTILGARLKSDRGSVGVLIALAIFLVCGMLTMTWNTVQLSKEKMRLQNAADAAALEYCIWQARGMNAVQNINDEAWVVFDTGTKLLNYTVKTETALQLIPIPFLKAAAEGLLCAVPGALSGLMTHWCGDILLKGASYFYVYGSCAFGHLGAQQFAAQNGASGIVGDWFQVVDFKCGLYTLGCSMNPVSDFVWLPLKQDQKPGDPFQRTEKASEQGVLAASMMKGLYKIAGTGKSWDFKPFVSKREGVSGLGPLPTATIWVALKYKNEIQTMDLKTWAGDEAKSGMHNSPMFAIAAAKCFTGDVIKHNQEPEKDGSFKVTNNRPVGFGTGATAKLVPVAQAVKDLPGASVGSVLGKVLSTIVYH